MTKLYPATTDKVFLTYLFAKCKENETERVGAADIIRDFFILSNNINSNVYDIQAEDSPLTDSLENEIECLKIHGFIRADNPITHVRLTPLGQYVANSFEIPDEIKDIIKNKNDKERIAP